MSFWQALFIGLLQGATELFPVSSLGHAVLVPSLLHWSFRQSDPSFVPFLVLLHLGTAGALLVLYRSQWVELAIGFLRAALRGSITTPTERLSMLLLVGTLPAGVLGVYLENRIKSLFSSPYVAATFLIVNGLLMLGFELLRRRAERSAARANVTHEEREERFADASQISFRAALIVGACQAFAFIPGISRSGVTIGGGLLAGLRHEEAARFSFLLGLPAIALAGFKELWELHKAHLDAAGWSILALGLVVASVSAFLAIWVLMRVLERFSAWPFVVYRAVLGVVLLIGAARGWLA